MRETLRDEERLRHIQVAIDNIFEFIGSLSFENYCQNKMLRFAVVKNLEIVGEAAYLLSQPFKKHHSNILWDDIIAMRHVLVHGYHQIKDIRVWNTIKNDLPQLQAQIQAMLQNSDL